MLNKESFVICLLPERTGCVWSVCKSPQTHRLNSPHHTAGTGPLDHLGIHIYTTYIHQTVRGRSPILKLVVTSLWLNVSKTISVFNYLMFSIYSTHTPSISLWLRPLFLLLCLDLLRWFQADPDDLIGDRPITLLLWCDARCLYL